MDPENSNRQKINLLLDELLQNSEQEQAFLQSLESYKSRELPIEIFGERVETLEAEKDRLFNIVALWLKSPLNSLEMLVKMLLQDVDRLDKTSLASFLQHLDSQVHQLQFSMRNLIEWACLEVKNYQFQPELFDIATIADKVASKLKPQAEKKGISLDNNISGNQSVFADEKMIQLILFNLLENAIKFSTKEAAITIFITVQNEQITVSIKDTGIGMGKAKQRNIFNLARKTQQKGTANENGFGLGLVVCKAILELHNTSLTIESERGVGTTVSFTLPSKQD